MHGVQESPPGLREAKKTATRRALSAAARARALAGGLDAVTVADVCADAGVSPRTFFNYFETKEHAVLGDPPPAGTPEARAAFLAGGPAGDLLTDVMLLLDPSPFLEEEGRAGITEVVDLLAREPRLLAAHFARLGAQEQEVVELVAARRGLPAPDATCTAVTSAAFALVHRACRDWFAAPGDAPLREVLTAVRAAFAAALAPAPAPAGA